MKTLGIYLAKGQMRYAVLDGDAQNPVLLDKDRAVTVSPDEVPALMDWYDTQFRGLLDTHKPDRIGYRLTLDPKKDQLFSSEFPLGILNLQAFSAGIPIYAYTNRAYVATRLRRQSCDLEVLCDQVFGLNPPYWDTNQKYAVLAAWFTLAE